jgi:hypothetical protein
LGFENYLGFGICNLEFEPVPGYSGILSWFSIKEVNAHGN